MKQFIPRRLILLTSTLLIVYMGALTAVAARRSADDNGYHCLQFQTVQNQRLLIDIRSGAQVRARTGLHHVYLQIRPPLASPDGRYLAYATRTVNDDAAKNTLDLWIDGADVSADVLTRLPLSLMLFKWVTNQLLVAGSVIDQQLIVATIDLSDPHAPVVTRREFAVGDTFAGTVWVKDALLVSETGVVNFWLPQRDAWVSYSLPLQHRPTQMTLFLPPVGAAINHLVIKYDNDDETGLFVLDPERGIIGALKYPAAEFAEVRWLAAGTRLRTWLRHNDDTAGEVTIWDVGSAGLTPLFVDAVPDSATGMHISSDDGSSYVYVASTRRTPETIRLHRLAGPTSESEDRLLQGHPLNPNFSSTTNALMSYVQDEHGLSILWIDGAGKVTTLVKDAPDLPYFSLGQDALITMWTTEAAVNLLIVDLRQDDLATAVKSYVLPATELKPSFFLQAQKRFGDVLITVDVRSQQPGKFRAFNLRTGQQIPLVPLNEEIHYVEPSDRAGDYFRVFWLTSDGRLAMTEFAPDGRRLATFIIPATINLSFFQTSFDRTRTIVTDSNAGDQYLFFSDGTYKSLPKLLSGGRIFEWTPDGSYIVGANANSNSSGLPITDAYLLDVNGDLLMQYPLREAWWSRTPLTRCS